MHRAEAREQLVFLLYSIIVGIALSVLYDLFVLLRRLYPKTPAWLVFIEDIVFCLFSGFVYFVFIFSANLGVARLFSFAGSLLGFFIWRNTFSNVIISLFEKLLRFAYGLLSKILKIFYRPALIFISIIAKFLKSFLCKIMIRIKMLKYLFIFSKKRDIIYSYIKKDECFDFESKEEYVKL